jgi:hypothetical protein
MNARIQQIPGLFPHSHVGYGLGDDSDDPGNGSTTGGNDDGGDDATGGQTTYNGGTPVGTTITPTPTPTSQPTPPSQPNNTSTTAPSTSTGMWILGGAAVVSAGILGVALHRQYSKKGRREEARR